MWRPDAPVPPGQIHPPHPQANWKPELIHLSCIHVLSYNHVRVGKTGCEIIVQKSVFVSVELNYLFCLSDSVPPLSGC